MIMKDAFFMMLVCFINLLLQSHIGGLNSNFEVEFKKKIFN